MKPSDGALNPTQRARDLERLADEELDVLVIGGGITGVGATLDAVTRGLRVGLVEQRDYASGTSSRSSKLFHGGLRYLEQFDFGLVKQALAERDLMIEVLCPHLVNEVRFVYPLIRPVWERLYVGAGIALYDMFAHGGPMPRRRHLSKRQLEVMAPDLKGHRGGILYSDGLVDDARHTLMVARTASAHGAALATSSRVVAVDGSRAEIVDLESDARFEVRSKAIVNATGVWSDDLQTLAGTKGPDIRVSKGVHIVVPGDRLDSEVALILRTRSSVLFVIPFDGFWIIGTTDTPWSLGKAHPAACRRDIDYLLEWVNTVLSSPITVADVIGVYAGLRPLLSGESDNTSSLSREHAIVDDGKGMISIAGGKYTTYRIMARDGVDALAPYVSGQLPRSSTHITPLLGSGRLVNDPPERLVRRYGSLSPEVLALIDSNPQLGESVVADSPYMRAEIVYAATNEGALHLDDFLARRTRMSIETVHRGTEAATAVAGLVGPFLGWDELRQRREVEHYRARVAAERDSQTQPDDHTADAARMGALDVRTQIAE